MYKYAIIGFGGLGKLHLANLLNIGKERGDIELKAICGTSEADFKSNVQLNLGTVDISDIDFSQCNFYTDYKELLNNEKLDFILSTLPTYLHEEVALYALSKDVHVFSEKPMALSVEACLNMIESRDKFKKKLMIGQCLRFEPMLQKLKSYIDSEKFGRVYRAEFTRYSQKPTWTWKDWILDPKLSGGCILDMHIHDVDLINWFFGTPKSLSSAVTNVKAKLESAFTRYNYDNLLVTSNADWSMPQKFPFTSQILVNFEKATIIAKDNKLYIYDDENEYVEEFPENIAFMDEMRAFLELALDGKECSVTSPESVLESIRIAFKEIESAKSGGEICF